MEGLFEGNHRSVLSGKRIALFTGAYNHIYDGVTLTLNRLVGHMEALGARLLVFSPTSRHPPPFEHAGTLVPVPSVPVPGRSDYRLSLGLPRRLRARLQEFAPDLVHIATPDYVGLQALRWASSRGVPVVASYHTHFGAYLKYFASYNKWYRIDLFEGTAWRYARWFYEQCRHVYVPTPAMAAELRSHGIRKGLRLWSRGVDTDRFAPTHRNLAWRHSRGIGTDDVVVAFVSRLVWEKGLFVFAEVINALEARGIPHKSVVVGEGPARSELGGRLPNTVFTGPLSGHELATVYASSDIFLFPSDTETFGNVTLEAMASGLPTVCADAAGSRSLVVDGETGFLAAPGDRSHFLERTAQLVCNSDLRARMGKRARARAHEFSWDLAMESMVDHYAEVLCPQVGPAARAALRPAVLAAQA